MACMHDHSCEDHDCSSNWSLFKHIDLAKVSALNEAVPGSVKSVFKAWEHRLNSSEVDLLDHYYLGSDLPRSWLALMCPCSTGGGANLKIAGLLFRVIGSYPSNNLLSLPLLYDLGYLESNDGDPELLVFIPFTSDVKIKSISIVGGADGTSPSKMRVFINREGIDFSDAQSMQAVQEWDLAENMQGMLEYQTRYSKFQSVGNITLHFPDNFGGDTSQIHYIGFKGEATQLKRDVVATIVYELMPNPSDHKTKAESGGGFSHVE